MSKVAKPRAGGRASRILLTGASGFVGSATLAALLADLTRPSVVAVSRTKPAIVGAYDWHSVDLMDRTAVSALVAEIRPDIVLHLAWGIEHGKFWTDPANLDWLAASLHLARAAAMAGTKRFVGAGTCYEYEWPATGACDEDDTPLKPALLYGVSKDATRRVLAEFAASTGLSFAWARLFFLYGPGEGPARLVPSIARALLSGGEAPCSSGTAIRDFLDVRDAAAGLARLVFSNVTGPINIASGEAVSVGDIARCLGRIAGLPERIKLGELPDRTGEPPRIVANMAKARAELGWTPRRSLETGLSEAFAWWRLEAERNDILEGLRR